MNTPDEITIGPLTFEYDGSKGMTVNRGEDQIGYCEFVFPSDWEEFAIASGAMKKPVPEPPVKFVFGFMNMLGKTYVGIAAQPFWEANKHLHDSSSSRSAMPYEDDDEDWEAEDKIETWLSEATNGILSGEAMESVWEMLLPKDETQARLEANGMIYVNMHQWDE